MARARPYDIDAVAIDDEETLRITISGDGALPPASELVSRITKQLGHSVKVLVFVVPKKPL